MMDIVEHLTLAMLNISMYCTIFLFHHVDLQQPVVNVIFLSDGEIVCDLIG